MYNNYQEFQNLQKQKKHKSPVPVIILIFVLITAIIILSGLIIYFREVKEYEAKLEEYDNVLGNLLKDYRDELVNLNDYEEHIEALNNQITELSNFTDNLQNNIQRLSSIDILAENSDGTKTINIAETAEIVSPSVIGIKVYVPAQNTNSFWQSSPIEATGSGIILTEDGYIVTNYHVVEYAVLYNYAVLTVVLSDEAEYTAEYIGGDEINDLAVIKISAKNLKSAVLGSSDNIKVGDFVMAIGNPLGINLYGSVTLGIISGVNRTIAAENVAEKLIQTDAAINPGNSGGALVNLNGEVIGINTVKISTSNVEGIGFAIPIDFAKPLIDSIIKYGYVKDRPTLGVSGMDISSSISRVYNVPRGLYVEYIEKLSGADSAGILEYDIITQIDGVIVYSLSDISKIIKTRKVGDTVTATLWRNGDYIDLNIILSEQR